MFTAEILRFSAEFAQISHLISANASRDSVHMRKETRGLWAESIACSRASILRSIETAGQIGISAFVFRVFSSFLDSPVPHLESSHERY